MTQRAKGDESFGEPLAGKPTGNDGKQYVIAAAGHGSLGATLRDSVIALRLY
ncbi:quinoprotein [Pseudomonas syringae pv. theae]|uniref:hypothetical protein n=1 Tax=Pseudomonas syringae TaxID=317 RepID=UPI0023BEB998|nr:hypothetical protein [Pseudomonas syringae]GKS08188.1 quinoprotein [Pseudomonas syringae pv. theae]